MQHDPVLARIGDARRRQGGEGATLAVGRDQRGQVDVGQRVARYDEERFVAEQVGAVAHAAGRPEQLLLVAVGHAVAEVVADRIREVMQVGDDLLDAAALEQVDDVRHDRPIEHRHHRLGDLIGDRP